MGISSNCLLLKVRVFPSDRLGIPLNGVKGRSNFFPDPILDYILGDLKEVPQVNSLSWITSQAPRTTTF